MRPYGFHLSISGGIHNSCITAKNMGLSALQFFSRNPRGWQARDIPIEDIEEFKKLSREYKIKVKVIHTNYLINIGSPEKTIYERSIDVLKDELRIGKLLGVDNVVVHLGSHRGVGIEKGLNNVLSAINKVLGVLNKGDYPILLLENSAGAGNLIGNDMKDIAWVLKNIERPEQVGVCIDSAHAFGSGYDVRVKDGMDRIFDELGCYGNRVKLLHLNDSKVELGSNRDRHEHLGRGYIGLDGLKNFLLYYRVRKLPVIMETPKDNKATDLDNLNVFLSLTH
ncbi:MAG: deoxyribonuclease IV [bacterium]